MEFAESQADPTEDLNKAINCIQRFIESNKNGEKQ